MMVKCEQVPLGLTADLFQLLLQRLERAFCAAAVHRERMISIYTFLIWYWKKKESGGAAERLALKYSLLSLFSMDMRKLYSNSPFCCCCCCILVFFLGRGRDTRVRVLSVGPVGIGMRGCPCFWVCV